MSNIPGVRITEVNSPSMASAAASGHVPLLLGCMVGYDGDPTAFAEKPVWIENYRDFLATFVPFSRTIILASGWGEPIVEKAAESTQEDESPTPTFTAENDVAFGAVPVPENNQVVVLKSSHIATGAAGVKGYFDNGGSPCYVMHCDSENSGAKIANALQEENDITLFVALDDVAKVAMQTAFPLLQATNPQAILITHQPYSSGLPSQPLPNNRYVATYTPALKFAAPRGELEEESTLLAGTGKTLAQLKVSVDEKQREQYANVTARRNTDQFDASILKQITLAPSGGVAGAFCKTERERGIWKTPANIQLIGPAPTHNFTPQQQGELSEAGFNPLLWSPRTGTVIGGGRTADTSNLNWRYVSVRLLFNAVERELQALLEPYVFALNESTTWYTATAGIRNYLYLLWKRGALQGLTPEQAYQVQVAAGEDDAAQGILRFRVALAPLRPAEFIELEFTQQLQVLA